MIDFIVRNLDSFIISTIFLILGFLPTILDPKKNKNSTMSFDNSNVTDSNIGNTHIQNTYNQNISYQNNIQNNYNNTQAAVVSSNPSTSSDSSWVLFVVISILIIIPIIFFYKYFNKIITYYIAITFSSILLSVSLIINLGKIKKYSFIPHNVLIISVRNIIAWIFLLINNIIIYFKVNYSYAMKPFISLIKSFDISDIYKIIENLSITFKFIVNNSYEGSLAVFMAASIACSTILMFMLFKSYIWAISSIKISTGSNNKALLKIYYYLNKQESKLYNLFWIISLLVVFLFSTGAFSYLIKLVSQNG